MDSSSKNGTTPTWTIPASSFIGGCTPSVTTIREKKSPLRLKGKSSCSLFSSVVILHADWMYSFPGARLTTKSIS